MRTTAHNFANRHATGFTLVELLLILFILGSLALLTTAVIDGVDEQGRYDDTKQRLTLIKRAIVGDPTRTVNGEPEISGFVADMGRLPACLRELLDGKCADADPDPAAWALDAQSGIWAGWRGPYLEILPGRDGLSFPDGWRTAGDEPNYGWIFGQHAEADGTACATAATSAAAVPDRIIVQSCGSDFEVGETAGDEYSVDYPTGELLGLNDWKNNLAGWDLIDVLFNNATGAVKTITANSLRLKLNYREDGVIKPVDATDLERDAQDFLSPVLPDANLVLPPASGLITVTAGDVTVPVGSALAGETLTLAEGALVFTAGRIAVAPCDAQSCELPVKAGEVLVPTGSSLNTSTWTLTLAGGDMKIPPAVVAPYLTGLGNNNFSLPSGVHALTLICNDVGNAANDGKRYDGTCADTPLNSPYFVKLAPRQVPPLKPNPLVWNIEQ
ncbi:MAG: hypothetical protein CVU15_08875 [Betaproteobacteria bacterium HGW-Betaproteobacteria-1]|jgi:hypothetical protein|nr:MAG: hypothetical protein CVU15_08875 [Betaproteobacteria bacterium HGW-Betaproteobacteria-1]